MVYCDGDHRRERTVTWRKSSYSGNGDCVEVDNYWFRAGIFRKQNDVILRDGADPEGLIFRFDTPEWRKFINKIKADGYGFGTTSTSVQA